MPGISVSPARSTICVPAGSGKVGADRDDPVAPHEDLPAGMDLTVDAVEHAGGSQQDRFRSGRRRAPAGPNSTAADVSIIIANQRLVMPLSPF